MLAKSLRGTAIMAIRAFVFDLDGVITDTAEYHYRAWKRLADDERIPFTREDNDALRGVSRQESLSRLLTRRSISESLSQDCLPPNNPHSLEYINQLSPKDRLPGVTAFLNATRGAGLKLGIASASKNARLVLERLGLTGRFDVIGNGHSVANPKPAPDLFLWVAEALQVPASESLVFEDAEAGIDAAKCAGCLTVGIGKAKVNHADIYLPNGLENANPAAILSQLEADRSTRG